MNGEFRYDPKADASAWENFDDGSVWKIAPSNLEEVSWILSSDVFKTYEWQSFAVSSGQEKQSIMPKSKELQPPYE